MELTRTPDVATPAFVFVPEGFHPTDTDALKDLVNQLLERKIADADELRQWIYDWSELSSIVSGEYSRGFTAMHRDTANEEFKQRNLAYQQNVLPLFATLDNKLTEKLLASPHVSALDAEFDLLLKDKRRDAELFREENTTLMAEDRGLGAKYSEIQGNLVVEFRGEQLTVQQAQAKLADQDRGLRKEVLIAIDAARAASADEIEDIFDKQIKIRQRIAKNAGFDNYRDFKFAALHRYDYTPADCETFHAAIEEVVIPAVKEITEYRKKCLGLDPLRPYDADVSIFGSDPGNLFSTQEEFVALTQRIFRSIDPVFEEDFDVLVRNDLIDLMSRPGKAPGGYNCGVEDMRLPFIFFNAVGRREDLRVLLHEGGHAFHTLAARANPLIQYRHGPTEFCEVASMAMEMFGNERLSEVMSEEDAREIEYRQMEGAVGVFASVARMDAFQHWLYTTDDPSREARRDKWVELADRYGAGMVDWTGFEESRRIIWHRIPHLFLHAFYYIEYALAQLGALQMWRKEKLDHEGTIVSYREALALGGSRPLKELFRAAGIRFAMDKSILEELIPPVVERMRELRN
ncbi:MAG: M3 family oligoendopeptidase [Planctomycetota bacterium]|jgi:oligoendopeptidase F